MPLVYYILMHEVWQGTFYVIVLCAYFGTHTQMNTIPTAHYLGEMDYYEERGTEAITHTGTTSIWQAV